MVAMASFQACEDNFNPVYIPSLVRMMSLWRRKSPSMYLAGNTEELYWQASFSRAWGRLGCTGSLLQAERSCAYLQEARVWDVRSSSWLLMAWDFSCTHLLLVPQAIHIQRSFLHGWQIHWTCQDDKASQWSGRYPRAASCQQAVLTWYCTRPTRAKLEAATNISPPPPPAAATFLSKQGSRRALSSCIASVA